MHIPVVSFSLLKKIVLAGVVLVCSFGFPYAHAANDDLVVEFEQTPLFNKANFLPGEMVSRTVKVTNNTGASQQITTEAIAISDPHHLGDVLRITVKEGAIMFFDGTLAEFFGSGAHMLSHLAAGVATTYTYSVSFKSDAGNAYQEESLGFDILVGFEGNAGDGNPSSPEGGVTPQGGGGTGGTSGGGGDSGGPRGLTITGELVRVVEIGETTVIIEWGTSYESTSRVVYGTASGLFNFSNTPNYGYPLSTIESDAPAHPNGVLAHRVLISGLVPATIYYFRTISHASPDTIGFEHTFTTLGSRDSQSAVIASGGRLPISSSGEVLVSAGGERSVQRIGSGAEVNNAPFPLSRASESSAGDTGVSERRNENLLEDAGRAFTPLLAVLSAALPFVGKEGGRIMLIVLIIALLLSLIVWRLSRHRRKNKK
ncbi:MAG: fibronectin type III domain-containing protein [bacterium]|nr:fibronectin type III domain-containing protein [bacterium]MDZ4299918.1 fibronectin type III domain-containing protein [Candidatus Sungbacteria bacterium]